MATCIHGAELGSCRFCRRSRRTRSLEDALAILESGYGSFEEYKDCAETFFHFGRYDLGEIAIVESLKSVNGRPGNWKLKYSRLVASFLQSTISRIDISDDLRESLTVISEVLHGSELALAKFAELMQVDQSDPAYQDLNEMAEEVATALALIDKGENHELVGLANFFRNGFAEWNPKLAKRERNRREAMKLGLNILNGVIKVDADDATARILRASILADLNQVTIAQTDVNQVLEKHHDSRFALLVGSRLDYLSRRGFEAWDKALVLFNQKKDAPVYGMLIVAYAVAEIEPGFDDPVSVHRLKTMRKLLDENAGYVSSEQASWHDCQLIEKNVTLNLLISDEMFGHAFIYLSELEREGWPGSTKRWLKQLEKASLRVGRSPRIEATLINPEHEDMFPDWLEAPPE